MFDPDWWQDNGSLTRIGGGRGGVHLVHASGERPWVLRHYRRGGFVARMIDDRYFFSGEERTRSFREWRLLAEIVALGLPAPRPVAARYTRQGTTYTADLLTVQIQDASPLSAFIASGTAQVPWASVGATIRRFHDAGICHADLNAHNILIGADGTVHLLDFDRGSMRGAGRWRHANLARLKRSLDKIAAAGPRSFVPGQWQALQDAYANR